jgi:hypothetical protein
MNTTIASPKNQLSMIRHHARQHVDHVFNQLLPEMMTGNEEDIERNKIELKWLTFENEDFLSSIVERLISDSDNDLIYFLSKSLSHCPYGLQQIAIGNILSFRDEIFQEKRRKQNRKVMTPFRSANSFGGDIIAKWRKGRITDVDGDLTSNDRMLSILS